MTHEHDHTAGGIPCEEVIERLFAYLDGEVDDVSSAVIERHLERCRDCFSRADFERKLRTKIAASASTPAPDRLRRRVRSLLDEF